MSAADPTTLSGGVAGSGAGSDAGSGAAGRVAARPVTITATMPDDFFVVEYPEPHRERARAILKRHPEVRELVGRNGWSFVLTAAIVALQLLLAVGLSVSEQPWWVILAVAWVVGALADHALWVLIHETSHNLIFKGSTKNRLVGLLANAPLVLPMVESFRVYHLKHHQYQGDYWLDADLAAKWEAKLIGNSFLGKLTWELLFPVFQAVRTIRFAKAATISFFSGWVVANWVILFALDAALVYFFGWAALGYLFASLTFSIGPHPVGARWIQEHFIVKEDQETYSYYGPLNFFALNVGYHNEHHDFPSVPWNRLPKLKALAPEMYEGLYAHRSWTGLWFRWLTDKRLSLFSRVTRDGRINGRAVSYPKAAFADDTFDAGHGVG